MPNPKQQRIITDTCKNAVRVVKKTTRVEMSAGQCGAPLESRVRTACIEESCFEVDWAQRWSDGKLGRTRPHKSTRNTSRGTGRRCFIWPPLNMERFIDEYIENYLNDRRETLRLRVTQILAHTV